MKNIKDFIYESAKQLTAEDLFELIKQDWAEGEEMYHDLKRNWQNLLKEFILSNGSKFSEANSSDSDKLNDEYTGENELDLSKTASDPSEYALGTTSSLGNKYFIGFGLNNGDWNNLTWYECL